MCDPLPFDRNFCKTVEFALRDMPGPKREDFRKQIKQTRLIGVSVIDCLNQHVSTEIVCIRFVRVLMGMPSMMVSEIKGVTFLPGKTGKISFVQKSEACPFLYLQWR